MPIYFGDTKVNPDGINKVYVGNKKVYEKSVGSTDLCFTAQQANSTIIYTINGTLSTNGIQKSSDGINWFYWDGSLITLSGIGDKIYVRNTNNSLSTSASNYFRFKFTGSIRASGNINSMINYAPLSDYCFAKMFFNNTALTTPPQLPATILAQGCYHSTFRGCTALTTPPQLPATSLHGFCYTAMFYGCTALTTPPQLPAVVLAVSCYSSMFYGCTSLIVSDTLNTQATYAWRIPLNGVFSGTQNQGSMFYQCSGTRQSDNMAGVSGQSYIYYTQNEPI